MAKRDKHISRLLKDQGKSLNPQARARESASRQQGFATKDSDKKSTKRKDPLVSKVAIQAALQRDRGHHASSEAPESKHTPMTNMLQPLPSGGNEGVRDDLVLRAGTGGKVHGNSGDPRGLGSSGQLQASQLSSNPQPTVASSTQTMHPEATCLSRASFRADGDVHDQSTRRTKASDGPNRVRSYSFAEGEDESLEFFTLTSETRTSPSKYPAILAEGDNGMRQRPSVLADVAAVVDEMEHTGIRTQGSGRLSTVQLSDRAIPAVATTAPIAPSTSSGSVIWLGGQGSGITRSHMVESSVWNQVSNGVDKGVGIMPSAISKRNGQEISASRVGFTADDRKAFPTLDLGSVSDSDSSSGDSTLMPVHRERVRGSSAQHGKSVVT
ncbi:hypothetical protein QBC34DRAFT_407621 [Podospora aff. communis PSN243]|uniref:Uncharacterized protein n=1 Tax=Podospora aff. communis PSN243 TaxID=3040156 RepID=A0AAV9GKF8_9PEZI|nr:hypothetical protein QBC34DRAFT_407621 [Podospora aff. communis PSN243]